MPVLRHILFALLTPAVVAAQGDSVIAITGGTLIDGNGGPPVPNATILVQRGRVTAVGAAANIPTPRGARVINAAGKFITPGFIDANVHVSIYSGLENFARYQDRFTDVAIEAAQQHLK